ncbi:MAG: restriction endonuclease subunit S [Nitrosotalea sp.]
MSKQKSESPWLKVRFDEICKNISDRIDDPKQADTDYYVGLEHLDSDDLEIRRHGIPEDMSSSKFRFKSGQILFGRRRAYQRKLAIAKREGICSTDIMVLEPIEGKIVKDLLPIFMQSEEFFERILTHSAGSLSPRVKWIHLAEQEFWIPSKLEQTKIIEMIRGIDITITSSHNLLKKFKILEKSLLDFFFITTVNSKKRIKNKIELEDLLTLEYGFSLPETKRVEGKIPVYGSNGITGFHDKSMVNGPGIIIGRKGTAGNVIWSESDFFPIDTTYYVKMKRDDVSLKWMYYRLKHLTLSQLALNTAVPGLNRNDVYDIIIDLSDKKTRDEFEIKMQKLQDNILKITDYIDKLFKVRKSILNSKLLRVTTKQEEKYLVQ